MGVSPFGNLRIEAYLQLPAAYRSLSRPSSAPDAKAFTLCSYSLELSIKSFDLCCSLELLEFHKQIFYRDPYCSKRFILLLALNRFPPCGEIVIYITLFGKTKFSLTIANLVKFCPLNLFVSTLQ